MSPRRDPSRPGASGTAMARELQFDRETALDLALDQFWSHGFNDTSMRDLAARLGVSLSSLYNTFGDKRTMFLAALERYDTQILGRRLDDLERNHPPLEAVRCLFESMAADCAADPVRRGCFLVNTALEMSPHDPDIEREVLAKLGSIEQFFLRTLGTALSRGDLSRDRDPKVMAAQLLAALLGIRVLARANPDPETLDQVVRGALALL